MALTRIKTDQIAAGAVTGEAFHTSIDLSGKVLHNFASTGIDDNASSTAITIDSSGNIGVGTSSPSAAIDVFGDAKINGITIGRGGSSSTDSNFTNTAIGTNALLNNGHAEKVAVGYEALSNSQFGFGQVGVGYQALKNSDGQVNVGIGYLALRDNTTGFSNTAIGAYSLFQNTTGYYNIAVGRLALKSNIDGEDNTAVGVEALEDSVNADGNAAFGYKALNKTTSRFNTGIGTESLIDNTTGQGNTGIGRRALFYTTTGNYNVAIGDSSGYYINGSNNTIIGSYRGTAPTESLSDTVVVAAGLTERFRIDSSGNMGIGTTAPSSKLEVVGTVTAPTFSGALSGNAATATRLQTARTIGGVSFNGTANINLPGVNTTGNQNTSGNASTATRLQTARTINGVSFNGTAAITLPTVNTAGNQTISGTKTFNDRLIIDPSTISASNLATTFIAGTGDTSIGTTANSYIYPFEYQYKSGSNHVRLLTSGFRKDAGTGWNGTAYRIQYAVDNSFTDSSRSYLDLGTRANGNGYVSLGTSSTDRLYIDSTGNVGIGTSSPGQILEIASSDPRPTIKDLSATSALQMNAYWEFRDSNNTRHSYLGFPSSSTTDFKVGNESFGGLTFYTSGTDRMRVDENGNVGIGTSSPEEKLSINGTILTKTIQYGSDQDDAYLIAGTQSYTGANTNWGTSGFQHKFKVNSVGTPRITVDVAGIEKFCILSNGNVGIGTSSPSDKLEIAANAFHRFSIRATDTTMSDGADYGGIAWYSNDASKPNFNNWNIYQKAVGSTGNTKLVIDSGDFGVDVLTMLPNGNVGIGTDNPLYPLHVADTHPQLVLGNTDQAGLIRLARASDGGPAGYIGYTSPTESSELNVFSQGGSAYLNIGGQDRVIFRTGNGFVNATERMRIANNGLVGIGTTPISDSVLAARNDSSGRFAGTFVNYSTGGYGVSIGSDSNSLLLLYKNGVRSGSPIGSIKHNGSTVSFNTSSDYRLKEDAQPVLNPIDRLMQLKPINFAWKVDGSRTDGFLAHEAQAVVPEAVTGTKDAVDKDGKPEYQGIDQAKLVPLLTAALQDAIKRIEQLEAQFNSNGT